MEKILLRSKDDGSFGDESMGAALCSLVYFWSTRTSRGSGTLRVTS